MAETLAAGGSVRRDVRVIGLIAVAHGLSHFYQLVVAVLFPLIKDDLGVSYAALGATTALFYTVSGVCQTLAGFAVDRFGARRMLLIGLSLCAAGVFLAGLAQSYEMLLFAALIAGLGNSVFHPVDFAILNARVDPRRLGYAFSFHGIGGTLGWALAPVFSYGIATHFGWHAALLAASGLGAAMIVLVLTDGGLLRSEASAPRRAGEPSTLGADVRVLLSTPVLMCFLYFLFLAAALIGVQNFGVAGLVALYEAPLSVASSALTAFLIGAAVGILTGGWVASHSTRHDFVAAGGMLASGLFMLTIASGALATVLIAPALALAGFCSGLTNPSRDLLVRSATPPGSSGKVYGFVYSGLDVGSMATPVLFGWMLDRGYAGGLFYAVCLLLVLTIGTILRLSPRPTRQRATA